MSFLSDECAFLAGAVAYQLFFSLVPLLVLLVGVLGFVYGPERAERQFVELLRSVYPSAGEREVAVARSLVEGRALSLGLGAAGTILGASAIFGAIDTAVARVLPGPRRGFVTERVRGFTAIGALALLALLSFALSYGAQILLQRVDVPSGARALLTLATPVIGLAIGFVFFHGIYRYVPRAPLAPGVVRLAALVSALLWEVAKVAFAVYTGALGAFNAYGPIAFAVGLLSWVYLTAVIILLGAEIMKVRTDGARRP